MRFKADRQARGLINNRFARVENAIRAFSTAAPGIAKAIYVEHISETFATEGFSKWAQLKERTVKDRIRQGYGGEHPILIRTGKLRDSLTRDIFVEEEAFGTSSELSLSTADRRFIWHQKGTKFMVARPMVPSKPSDKRALCRRIEAQLLIELRRHL